MNFENISKAGNSVTIARAPEGLDAAGSERGHDHDQRGSVVLRALAEGELRHLRSQLKSIENERSISERNVSQLERKKPSRLCRPLLRKEKASGLQ